MGYFVVERIRPNGCFAGRNTDAAVVYVAEVFHDLVLGIATWFQVRRSHTDHLAPGYVTEVLQDLPHTDHLARPLVVVLVLETLLKSVNE